jgi:regulatory protein
MLNRPPTTLRARALMWLAQREHSRHELQRKLVHWLREIERRAGDAGHTGDAPHIAAEDIEPLLDALQSAGQLSDARFVESRLHARSARYGNRRIEQELKLHGAAPDDDQRQSLKASEVARGQRVWAARFGAPPRDATERARQMRFLAARGFTSETIRKVVAGDDSQD